MPQIFADEKSAALISLEPRHYQSNCSRLCHRALSAIKCYPTSIYWALTSLLSNLLPNAPQLDAQSDALSQIFLVSPLGYLKLRLAEVFDKALNGANKAALENNFVSEILCKKLKALL